MKDYIRQAFFEVRDGYPPDRVVADPLLNRQFLQSCRARGLEQADVELNRCLINLRKTGDLPDLKSRKTSFPNQDEYSFASEIAIRFLERRDGTTLDRVICDPVRAQEFDGLAARIAPGYSSLQYRWAALSLRKKGRLKPELVARILQASEAKQIALHSLKIPELSTSQGVYVLYTKEGYLYAGETENLRNRIKKHLDHSDNRGMARWLWEHENDELFIEYYVLPADTSARDRKAVELELIRSRKPIFNSAGMKSVDEKVDSSSMTSAKKSLAKESLRLASLFEAEVLTQLLLEKWDHPFSKDRKFVNDMVGSAQEIIQQSVLGTKFLEDVPPNEMSFIGALWYSEWAAVTGAPDEDIDGRRQKWLDSARRCLPSCFCSSDDLFDGI